MTGEHPDRVEREIRIAAQPETVFRYLTDPERIARWCGTVLAFDPRPGGEIRLAMSDVAPGSGKVVEIDPPRRLVYTWGWDEPGHPIPPGSTRVEIDLTPDGDGTRLRLRHFGLPLDAVDGHGQAWQRHLDQLAIVATGDQLGPSEEPTSQSETTSAARPAQR